MAKEVTAVIGGEALEGVGQRSREIAQCPSCRLAQVRFEFGKGHFDRVEIGAVGGQITYRRASGLDEFFDRRHFVRGEVVEDDDVSRVEFGAEHLAQINRENIAIDDSLDEKWRGDPVMAQRGQKGGALPVAVKLRAVAAFSRQGSSVAAGHLGVHARFINEDEPGHVPRGLVRLPLLAFEDKIRPVLFGGARRFF